MVATTITKQLAGMEDLAAGVGKVTQTRAGKSVEITLMDIPYAVSSTDDLAAININSYTYARVGNLDYRYSSTSSDGYSSNYGTGSWIPAGAAYLANNVLSDIVIGANVYPIGILDVASTTGFNTLSTDYTFVRLAVDNKVHLYKLSQTVSGTIASINLDGAGNPISMVVGGTTVYLQDVLSIITGTLTIDGFVGDDDYRVASLLTLANETNASAINFGSESLSNISALPSITKIIKSDDAELVLAAGKYVADSALLSTGIQGKFTISGPSMSSDSIVSVAQVSTGTFDVTYYTDDVRSMTYTVVRFTTAIASSTEVGDVLLIDSSTYEEYNGAFEVIAVGSGYVDVMHIGQGTLRFDAVSATVTLCKTVVKFPSNITAVKSDEGTLVLNNIAFLGACFPYDYDDRSNLYDPAGGNGGVTGIVSDSSGEVVLNNCGVIGFSGTQVTSNDVAALDVTGSYISGGGRNGVSASSNSKTIASNVNVSANLLDGIIAQDASFIFGLSATSASNGRHGIIASNNASITTNSSLVTENGYADPTVGCGIKTIGGGTIVANSSQALRNALSNYDADGMGSYIKATSASAQEAGSYGVRAYNSGAISFSGYSQDSGTYDLYAVTGGVIHAVGTTYSTAFPIVDNYYADMSMIQVTTTLSEFKLSANGSNTAMRINDANLTAFGMSPVSGITARAYIGGNTLVNGALYLKDQTTGTYYRGELNNGTLAWTDSTIS